MGPVGDVRLSVLIAFVVDDVDVAGRDRCQVHEGDGATPEPSTRDRDAVGIAPYAAEGVELDPEPGHVELHPDQHRERLSADRPDGQIRHAGVATLGICAGVAVHLPVCGHGVPQGGDASVGAGDLEDRASQEDGERERQRVVPADEDADREGGEETDRLQARVDVPIQELHGTSFRIMRVDGFDRTLYYKTAKKSII